MKNILATVLLLLGLGNVAQATVLDFNTATDCTSPNPDVSLSLVVATDCLPFNNPGIDPPGLGIYGPGQEIMQADFSVPVNMVSVDLGDFGGADSDLLFLEIFDAGDSSLGFVDFLLPASTSAMQTLALSSLTNIAYAQFGSLADGGFVAVDNLTFDGPAEIPLPAAVWLFGTALIGLIGFSKRSKAA